MKFRRLSLILLGVAVCASGLRAAEGETPSPWRLVWSEEFEKPGFIDPEKWDFEVGFIRNHEQQFYTRSRPENARVEGGHLVIEARREDYQKARFTSASLITKGKKHFRYGRFEVRAKLPGGRGVWPAIWMLGANMDQVGWPMCGEIDLMEYVGFDPDRVHVNIHTKKYNHIAGTGRGANRVIPQVEKDFHVYALEWTKEKLVFQIDGETLFTYANDGTGVESWPFDAEHYLILNLAIGGSWGGAKGVDEAIFPQKFLIDYVRVYEPVP